MSLSATGTNRPEITRRSLLTILFADDAAAQTTAQLIGSEVNWRDILDLAEAWSVVPQLHERVPQLAITLPGQFHGELKTSMFTVFARSASFASKAVAALQHLHDAGISAVAFKGVASMTRLYQPAAARTIRDADILVAPDDLLRTIKALGQIGFAPQLGLDPSKLDHLLENMPGSSGNKAITLVKPGSVEIDLHWSIGLERFPVASLLERAKTLILFGQHVRVVAISDSLQLTARHSVRENFAVDSMCRDLLDVSKSCELLASQGNLRNEMERVAAHGDSVALLALTGILRELNDRHAAAKAERILEQRASPSERNVALHLRLLFFMQIQNGAFRKDLLYLLHAAPTKQILRGAFTNWRNYRGFMRSMERKLDGQELPLSQRVANLLLALRELRPAHFRSMRTLARVKYDQ
jgi:hypothetical protein